MRITTVATGFNPKDNIVGLMRLVLAASVLVSHTYVLGYGRAEPLHDAFRGQTDLGKLAVYGFFVLSGFLIYTSANRAPSATRYFWHRALRIFPAYWVCLLLTAFGLGTVLYLVANGTFDGFWWQSPSPTGYVLQNSWLLIQQYGIGDLLGATPYGETRGSVFNGALWSLHYEFACYIVVAGVVFLGRRYRGLITLALAVALFALSLNAFHSGGHRFDVLSTNLPRFQLGIDGNQMAPLLLCFLLGALAAAFPRRFPLDYRLALIASAVVVITARQGYFGVIGVLAFAYVILWIASLRVPRLTSVGVANDYSYGFYIYAFPIQQTLALIGVPDAGVPVYLLACAALTAALAAASWHWVEKPAMRWRSATLVIPAPRAPAGSPTSIG